MNFYALKVIFYFDDTGWILIEKKALNKQFFKRQLNNSSCWALHPALPALT